MNIYIYIYIVEDNRSFSVCSEDTKICLIIARYTNCLMYPNCDVLHNFKDYRNLGHMSHIY